MNRRAGLLLIVVSVVLALAITWGLGQATGWW